MKKIYLGALAVAFAATATAQSKQGLVAPKVSPQVDITTTKISNNKEAISKLKKVAFWSEDFSNGFAGQGSNGAFTQEGQPTTKGTIPMWEYRGPQTTPDVSMGSNGSCGGANPIQSETATNGFVIFDSNGLDEPLPAMCAGSGSGPAPSPHNATLYTPSIDMSSQSTVQLFFTMSARNFQAAVNIIVIADGDTTTVADIYSVLPLAANVASAPDELVGIDLTSVAAGKSDVKVGFNFNGDYYYFMMDDIFFDEVPEYDYSLVNVFNDDISDFYEYFHLPLSQSHLLQPGISVTSKGTQPVDLTLSVTILDPDSMEQTFSTTLNNFPKDSISDVNYIDTYAPTKVGLYTMTFKVSSPNDSDDLGIANNTRVRNFRITEDLWSDAFTTGAGSFRAPEVDGAPGESEHFQVHYTYEDVTVYGMDFLIFNSANAPDEATFIGDELQYSVFNIDKDAFQTAVGTAGADTKKSELFTEASSDFYVFEDESVLTTTMITPISVYFPTPITIPADNLFAISIYNSGGGYFRVPVTNPGTNSDLSGAVRARGLLADPSAVDDDELLFFNNVNPWLRVRTAPNTIGINDENISSLIGDAVPNPAKGNVSISYTLLNQSNVSLTVTDLSGKVLMTQNEGSKGAGVQKITFDVSQLNAGIYLYSVNVNGNATTKKLVVTK